MSGSATHRAGVVAIIGRPNVGKSTLLNQLVGARISITSAKQQTTRHAIRGILTRPEWQFVFVDTPGFQTRHRSALNRGMNRGVVDALAGVDAVFLVVEAGRYGDEDRRVLSLIPPEVPVVLVINKIDLLPDRRQLLPYIDRVRTERAFAEIYPVSAERGTGLEGLLDVASALLPEGPPLFEEDALTDRSERFLAGELLREKLFRRLGEELPYGLTVEVERFVQEGALRRIHAAIVVERQTHKPIVIGAGGQTLKACATQARKDMERLFGGKVFLEVWVKVREGWSDDERALKSLGYG